MARIKEELYHLTEQDSNITKANATASAWSDLYKFQVPVGTSHVLQPGHAFSLYLLNTSSTENAATALIKIERRDSSEQDKEVIYGPTIYAKAKEFQDRQKMAFLNLVSPVKVTEKQWLVVMVNGATAAGTASSYFDLETVRVRETLS